MPTTHPTLYTVVIDHTQAFIMKQNNISKLYKFSMQKEVKFESSRSNQQLKAILKSIVISEPEGLLNYIDGVRAGHPRMCCFGIWTIWAEGKSRPRRLKKSF